MKWVSIAYDAFGFNSGVLYSANVLSFSIFRFFFFFVNKTNSGIEIESYKDLVLLTDIFGSGSGCPPRVLKMMLVMPSRHRVTWCYNTKYIFSVIVVNLGILFVDEKFKIKLEKKIYFHSYLHTQTKHSLWYRHTFLQPKVNVNVLEAASAER